VLRLPRSDGIVLVLGVVDMVGCSVTLIVGTADSEGNEVGYELGRDFVGLVDICGKELGVTRLSD
jgi:hypothetical protein